MCHLLHRWFACLCRWRAQGQSGLSALSPWGHRFLWSAVMAVLAGPMAALISDGAQADMLIRSPLLLRPGASTAIPPSIRFTPPPPASPARAGESGPLQAQSSTRPGAATGQDPGAQCRRAAQQAGRAAGLPEHLMSAIARVESGRRGQDGQIQPWPWSINVAGTDHVYDTKDQVIAAVRQFQAQGIRSIDVGCMQVNLLHHPNAFASLDQAFDPAANAAYAAHFLLQLFAQSGSWAKATADYHSATPELGGPYQQKVMSVLPQEMLADAQQAVATGFATRGGMVRPPAILSGQPPPARVIPLSAAPAGAAATGPGPMVGRGLDAYRAAPVRIATRLPH